ncbi:hypothetical protein Gpo141_00009095 [Globisporangium polare]
MSEDEPSKPHSATAQSTLEKFLALRKLSLPPKRVAESVKATTSTAKPPTKISALPSQTPAIWKRYSKHIHGERVTALRDAMRAPTEDFSDSRDAYNPKKPLKRFIKVHAEEEQVGIDFHVHTRAMFFEREKVDRDVCDRLENRQWYDEQLKQIYSHD